MARNDDEMIVRTALRFLYGPAPRVGGRTPYRSRRARETALKFKPWTFGRVGSTEQAVLRELVLHGDMTTGDLARAVYLGRYRPPGEPAPAFKPWMRDTVKRAATLFADPVARSLGPGRPWLWRLRPNQYHGEIRARRTAQIRSRAPGKPQVQP